MKPDPSAMKLLLRKREMELRNIIKQMKSDKLHSSPVYRSLEQELETLQSRMTDDEKSQ